MAHEISPGVERAAASASQRATAAGAPAVRLTDWMLALLEDDEGRPFELLIRAGIDGARLRDRLPRMAPTPAPEDYQLYSAARAHAIRLRGDPDLTTDVILFAVILAREEFQNDLERNGVSAVAVERALRSDAIVAPLEASLPVVEFVAVDPVESSDAARILDANLNRARESLRVLDDYARFALNDRTLTDELKSLRHRLAGATDLLPPGLLLKSRDTAGDVGTSLTASGEYDRATPLQVAAVNFKRLQESLRSLEEFGKLDDSRFAREIEQIRYAAYTLERAAVAGTASRERLATARVYVLLTASQCAQSLDWTIAEAAAGGASIFQLREKAMPDRELLQSARQVREWTRKANALFIVNDRPDIARLVEADGVHLGQEDLPVRDARRILGPDSLIGVSTHSLPQLRQAILDGADYLGVGPTFPSTTKSFDALAGLKFVGEAFSATSLPAFALGGIAPENIAQVIAAGANRVAVSAAVATSEEPRDIVRQLMDSLDARV